MAAARNRTENTEFEEDLRRGRVVVRFAGDSGDGIQVLGGEFSKAVASEQHDILTFADFPAEIRAPVGTLFGVSAFQIQFGGPMIFTTGDQIDVLFAFNPAALKTNIGSVRDGGYVLVDSHAFNDRNLAKSGYETSPLESGELARYRVIEIDITKQTREIASEFDVSKKDADRTKNFWALGLAYWMFEQSRTRTENWMREKFGANPGVMKANIAALNAGHAYGETMELEHTDLPVAYRAEFEPGLYRATTGTEALTFGLAAASVASGRKLCFCSYPITPASGILHGLARFDVENITTFQAEDEIAAVCAAIGASFGGALGVTASSGPGIALKGEALGLAVGAELPLVVIDVQRAGPSTGMPTKTEQSDLELALYGRHGEAPAIVLAPSKASECYTLAIEAARLSARYMVPVILLIDGYTANAAEPWRIPDITALADFDNTAPAQPGEAFLPFGRDPSTLSRPWVPPGAEGFEHRIGGIERADGSGNISYDPSNHQKMTDLRAEKVERAAADLPPARVDHGPSSGEVAVVGWGSTYGPIEAAVNELLKDNQSVSHIHLRSLSPLPRDLEAMLQKFDKVLIVEMNNGQLWRLLRSEFLLPARKLTQVSGQPFKVATIRNAIYNLLEE